MNASIRDFTVTGEKDFRLRRFPTSLEIPSEERDALTYLILCTVSGVAAGLQNTG